MQAEVVVDGIVFGEGPVWVPENTAGGPTLVVTSVAAGAQVRPWRAGNRIGDDGVRTFAELDDFATDVDIAVIGLGN